MTVPIPPRVRFVMMMEALFRNWLQAFLLVFGVFNLLALLAPISMATGLTPVGNTLYDLYGIISHQYANRSYFLFGESLMIEAEALPLALNGTFDHDAPLLKQFRGSAETGWKWAYSDRLVSMFAAMWITALIYWLLRGRELRPLALWMAVMLIAPLILDGLTHMISDGASVTAGFRYDNQWLAELSGGVFGAHFYAGDGIGTFNQLMRLFTGIAFGIGLMGYALVRVEGYFRDRAALLADKLADWHRRQQNA